MLLWLSGTDNFSGPSKNGPPCLLKEEGLIFGKGGCFNSLDRLCIYLFFFLGFSFFLFFSKGSQYFALYAPSIPFAEKCYRYREYIRRYLKTRNHVSFFIHSFAIGFKMLTNLLFPFLILQSTRKCHTRLDTIHSFPVSVST